MGTLTRAWALGALEESRASVAGLAADAGARHGIDPALLLAVMEVESGYAPSAINPRDPSYGLMQIRLPTAAEMLGYPVSADDLLDPWLNVDAGARYLRRQLDRYGGDTDRALSAYNAGTATDQNRDYVARVRAAMGRGGAVAPPALNVGAWPSWWPIAAAVAVAWLLLGRRG